MQLLTLADLKSTQGTSYNNYAIVQEPNECLLKKIQDVPHNVATTCTMSIYDLDS